MFSVSYTEPLWMPKDQATLKKKHITETMVICCEKILTFFAEIHKILYSLLKKYLKCISRSIFKNQFSKFFFLFSRKRGKIKSTYLVLILLLSTHQEISKYKKKKKKNY